MYPGLFLSTSETRNYKTYTQVLTSKGKEKLPFPMSNLLVRNVPVEI